MDQRKTYSLMRARPDHSPRQPFAHAVDPDVFYRSPIHESVCAELFAAAKTHAGLLVLSGEPGTGKTAVLRRLAHDLEQAGGRVLWCGDILSLREMFHPAGGGPGAPGAAPTEALLATLQARVHSDGVTMVAVDEAQRLEPAELGILQDLAEAGLGSGKPLAVLLVGLPELDVKLAHLMSNRAGQASATRVRLSRLKTPDVPAYMAYRLGQAGLRLNELFQPEAVERIAAYAEGVPRVINQLCHGALGGARRAGLTRVSAPTVDAAAYWLGLPHPADARAVGPRRERDQRLKLRAARWGLAGWRPMRAWAADAAALGRSVARGGGVAGRRLTLRAARWGLAGWRAMGACAPDAAALGRSVARGGSVAGRRLTLRAARWGAAGRRMVGAWSMGPGIAALGLGAIVTFLAFRSILLAPSPTPQPVAPAQERPAELPPAGSAPSVAAPPSKTARVIERPPPSATPQRVKRPEDTGRGRAPQPSVGRMREGAAPPPPQPARQGSSAASALLDSAEMGNLTEVRGLIAAGASPNARDAARMTPLMMAVIHNHGAVAEYLLARGADVDARDVGGVTALMLAANNGRAVLVQRLLARGANVNAQTPAGWTALTYAAWKGHPSVVRRLLESGADPALLDRTGRTALQYATWRAADPADPSAVGDPALAALAHLRYVELIDLLRKASRPN